MRDDNRVQNNEAQSSAAEDIKSKILDHISKEVKRSKGYKDSEFQFIAGDPAGPPCGRI
jgi:hypothetical protein